VHHPRRLEFDHNILKQVVELHFLHGSFYGTIVEDRLEAAILEVDEAKRETPQGPKASQRCEQLMLGEYEALERETLKTSHFRLA
jgi:hypothetical protein